MQAVVKKVVYSFRYRPGPGQVGSKCEVMSTFPLNTDTSPQKFQYFFLGPRLSENANIFFSSLSQRKIC